MKIALIMGLFVSGCLAQDTKFPPQSEQIPGPPSKAETAAWLADISRWRNEERVRAGLAPENYARPELKWAQSSFMQPQAMVEDRYLYDPASRRYTVDRYLDDVEKRYGGIDSILLWHVYPNVGIDDRSQFDLLRDLPGGVDGVRRMIEDFHRRHVRVLFPTMPWELGTNQSGMHAEEVAKLMAEVGADGVNGDTYNGMPRTFRTASDTTSHPVVFEPENAMGSDEMVNWNHMSWGYWQYPFVPMVSRYKWLEPRHMINVCNRWSRDKTNDLQAAFFNGVGFETWENVWGIWNGITDRDAGAIRRVAKIEREFAVMLVSPEWEPHTPTVQFGIFASRFPTADRTLWTIVNRGAMVVDGVQLSVAAKPGMRYFDLWHGVELQPSREGERMNLSFEIEGLGFGAVLAFAGEPDARLQRFLSAMKAMSERPLAAHSKEWRFLPQRIVEIPKTKPDSTTPAGMVTIPAARFAFEVSGIEIEGGEDVGVDVQYPWEDSPRRHHNATRDIAAFFIDKYPVTNRAFKEFLDASGYHPADDHNFLKDWVKGKYPDGWGNKPVTWVSIEDARAYAAWAGKRLPHEWEWQYAAQGTDSRTYPWGNDWDPKRMPPQEHGQHLRASSDVDAYPDGASPFGVMDLTGNVWQWTDEFTDDHTRAAILRGGGYYRPSGSRWYFPQTFRLEEHGKYLLMAPSKDRSGTIGFRCVRDAQ